MKKKIVILSKAGRTIRALVNQGSEIVSARNTGRLDYPRLEITYKNNDK